MIDDVRPTVAPLPADFSARWTTWYGETPPIGFLLRDAHADRWFRIHSLPDAQRYPASGWQQAELHRRHAAVATDVLGDGEECALLLFRGCDGEWSRGVARRAGLGIDDLPSVVALSPALWDARTGYFDGPVELTGAAVRWDAPAFTSFVAAVGDDVARGILVNLATGRVYAPYDGGADLFMTSEEERDAARERYADWLPHDAPRAGW